MTCPICGGRSATEADHVAHYIRHHAGIAADRSHRATSLAQRRSHKYEGVRP